MIAAWRTKSDVVTVSRMELSSVMMVTLLTGTAVKTAVRSHHRRTVSVDRRMEQISMILTMQEMG